jgi:trehalose 6-phosphate synthase/phosphatase
MDTTRLVVVSNRLSIVVKKEINKEWSIKPASGGLVTALGPVLRNRGGLWIGWLGMSAAEPLDDASLKELLAEGAVETGYTLIPVALTKNEIRKYYFGFSNEILWPLFHDLSSRCNFDPAYWEVYKRVNHKFAETIAQNTREEEDFIWVHDYQLITVSHELKKMGLTRHTGFFLHIPFPPLDVFIKMPWRFQILEALLEYDLVGFQTVRDRRNFLDCVRMLIRDGKTTGHGQVCELQARGRHLMVGVFPISIDFKEFAGLSATPRVADVASHIHANLPQRQLILGVDRLDYTKGIPRRLLSLANALDRFPDMRGQVTLIQVVVPSRRDIVHYEALKQEIERLVGEINGYYTQLGWTPIHYIFGSLNRSDLVAYYRACEIALITPLKDGMNLVAKEYCASSIDDHGVLILSEFAGAAAQLHRGAILVNPYDIEGVADAIHRAFHMESEERRARMRRLRRSIRRHNIYHWVNSFLKAGVAKDLSQFPNLELFVPRRSAEAGVGEDGLTTFELQERPGGPVLEVFPK